MGQKVHLTSVSPKSRKKPFGQLPHSRGDLAPIAKVTRPSGHVIQSVAPGFGLYLPISQGMQSKPSAALTKLPGGQMMHSVFLELGRKRVGQGLHFLALRVVDMVFGGHDVHLEPSLNVPGWHGAAAARRIPGRRRKRRRGRE